MSNITEAASPAPQKTEKKDDIIQDLFKEMPYLKDSAVGFMLTPGTSIHPKAINILYLVMLGLIGALVFMFMLPNINRLHVLIMFALLLGLFFSLQW